MSTTQVQSGYSPREAEIIADVAYKGMYQQIRLGKIEAYESVDGSIKIAPEELQRWIDKRERIRAAINS